MKTTLALLAFTAGLSQATAATMNCTIQEAGTSKQETKVQHNIDETASHGFTQFNSAYATGFVAVSRGYGVVNVISKATGKSSSFYGKIGGGLGIGGTLYIGKDDNDSFSVECM